MNNPDYKMYPHVYNLIAQKGQHMPPYYNVLVDPFDSEAAVKKSEAEFADIKVPTYTGSGWYGYTYKTHLNGCQHWYQQHQGAEEALARRARRISSGRITRSTARCCAGTITGSKASTPASWTSRRCAFWVMGANEWRTASDWPLPRDAMDQALSEKLGAADARHAGSRRARPRRSRRMRSCRCRRRRPTTIQRLRYMTDPLPHDVLVAGPIVVTLYAAIDQDDTNWIVILKDVGPDVSVLSVREGEREVPKNLHEREITRGWLKASHRAIDPERSKPWWPWHPLTPRGAKAGHAGRDRGISDRGDGDRQPVPPRATASASTSPASTCRPASPAQPMPNMCPTTSARAKRCCTRSFTTASIPRMCCCRSSRSEWF